jgi:hypothetical protein
MAFPGKLMEVVCEGGGFIWSHSLMKMQFRHGWVDAILNSLPRYFERLT